jgi:tetratricopeptide (TPR) repeat protein
VIELVTLGHPAVSRDRVPLSVPPQSPEFLLLVHLTLHGATSPDELGALFWPEEPPEGRRARLDQALDHLHGLLGSGVVWTDDELVEVDPGRVTADVERFREAMAGDRPRDALALYRGPFLEGLDLSAFPEVNVWMEETRRTLAGMARRARDQVPWDDDPPKNLWPRIVQELRSRRVVHVALLYLGFAWGSLEVCSTLVQMELFGNAVFVALLAFHVVSFPLVVTTAWLLEGTRAGDEVPGLPDVLGKVGLRAVHLLALLAVLTAGSVLGWVVLQWGDGGDLIAPLRAELPEEKHLAVLPFHVLGEDPLTLEFSDGLMETLTSRLTQFEGLKGNLAVISSADIRGRGVRSPREARDAFGVNLAVTGSVGAARDSIQVTVNLVDADRGRQFGSFGLSESLQQMDRLQTEIVTGLRQLLELELETAEEASLASGRTESPEAYGLQVRAQGFLQRYERLENLDRALELFREALAHDPDYVLALAGMGEAYKRRYDLTRDPADLERAREAVLSARELNERLAQVHVTLGLIHAAGGRHEEAVHAFGQALDLEPFSVGALLGLGAVYREMGRPAEAERTLLRAQEIRSGDWRLHNELGVLYSDLGRYEEGAEQFRRVVALTPDNPRGWTNLGAMNLYLGRLEAAEEYLERSVSIAPTESAISNLASFYYYTLRDYQRAAELYEEAVALNERDYLSWLNLASAYRQIPGEEERARAAYRSTLEWARAAQDVNPRDPDVLLSLAVAHANLGEPDRARFLVRQAQELAPGNPTVLFRAGDIHETLGDREEAIRLIREAMERGYPPELVEAATGLDDLRADPRFPGTTPDEAEGQDADDWNP